MTTPDNAVLLVVVVLRPAGPHQLQAYTQIATQLATAIATNATVPAGTPPVDYSNKVIKSKVRTSVSERTSKQLVTAFRASVRDHATTVCCSGKHEKNRLSLIHI